MVDSDLPIMEKAMAVLNELGADLLRLLVRNSRKACGLRYFSCRKRLSVIVAMFTVLPILIMVASVHYQWWEFVHSSNSIDGWILCHILQMPAYVPVATVALDGGRNAGILAAQIIGASTSC